MLGAIIGDIVGSRFEFNNVHTKNFEFFHEDCHITDDSAMTIAVMYAIINGDTQNEQSFKPTVINAYKKFWMLDPDGDYGMNFSEWLNTDNPEPYFSFGNGACMRISPVAVLDDTRDSVAKWATEVSHNHPIAISWVNLYVNLLSEIKSMTAEAGKACIKQALRHTISDEHKTEFYINGVAEVNPGEFDETVSGTMPIAMKAVIDAEDFEDAVRSAVAYGGDSDTIASIAGALAEAVFGIPNTIKRACLKYIPVTMISTIHKFNKQFPAYA